MNVSDGEVELKSDCLYTDMLSQQPGTIVQSVRITAVDNRRRMTITMNMENINTKCVFIEKEAGNVK